MIVGMTEPCTRVSQSSSRSSILGKSAWRCVLACAFCRIVDNASSAVVLYEDSDVLAFLDLAPIRVGHAQVIPKAHIETFEQLPPALAARVLAVGQRPAGDCSRP